LKPLVHWVCSADQSHRHHRRGVVALRDHLMKGFPEFDLRAVSEEVEESGRVPVIRDQRAKRAIGLFSGDYPLHGGGHDGDFQRAVGGEQFVAEAVEPLARLEVMQAVSERPRRSCCDGVELFLQRRWWSGLGNG
jgi:hypothetical protein